MSQTVANLLLRVTGDNRQAKDSLNEVARRLTAFSATDAEARIRLAGADGMKRELGELERSLDIIGSRNVTARVKVKIDNNRSQLATLRKELDFALGGGVGSRGVKSIAADIARVGSNIATLGTQTAGVFSEMASGAVKLGTSLGSALLSSLIAVIAQLALFTIAAALLLPIISALLGVLAALAAGLLAAAAGFAALAVAGLGLLVPALLVLVGIISRIVGAYKALKDSQDKAKENSKALAQAEETHAEAVLRAAEAQQRVSESYVEGLHAQRDAALAAKEAELALADARLGIVDADIRLERAKLNLKEMKEEAQAAGPAFAKLFNKLEDVESLGPNQLAAVERKIGALPGKTDSQLDVKEALQEIAHAQLGVRQAKLAEESATNRLADANERNNEFIREGVRAYEPYNQAIKAAADAQREVARTQEAIGELRKEQNADLKKYSKTELTVAGSLIKLFEKIKEVFGRVAKPALDGLMVLIESITELLNDSGIQSGLDSIGEAFGYVFRQFAKLLRVKEVREIFADLLRLTGRFVRVVGGDVLTSFFLVMLRIARAAAPALIEMFSSFGRFLRRISTGADAQENFNKAIRRVIRTFRIWMGIAKEVARVIINFIKGAIGESDHLARKIRRVLRNFADFLATDEGREKVKQWLQDSIALVGDLITVFKDLYGLLKDIISVFKDVKDAYNFVSTPGRKLGEAIGDSNDQGVLRADALKLRGKITAARDAGRDKEANALEKMGRGLYPGLFGFKRGGIVTKMMTGLLGDEPGVREAVIPLKDTVLAGIGRGIVEATARSTGPSSRSLGRGPGAGGDFNQYNDITLPPPPAADVPDARASAVMLARELARRGGGSLVG